MEPEDRPEEPQLPEWAEAPWRAWNDLAADRQHVTTGIAVPLGGMHLVAVPQPITWTAMQAWCDRAGLCDEERESFVVPLIRVLDREFIEHQAAERKKPAGGRLEDKLSRWDAA